MTTRESYLSTRKELIQELKSLGVENPARLYPTVKMVAQEDDPTCTVLRMKHHIADLKSKKSPNE